jgi:alpha-1,2-mannosyltransferase
MSTRDLFNLGRVLRQAVAVLLFGVLPLVLIYLVLSWTYDSHTFLSDFHGDLYSAGRAILAGRDPYRLAFLSHQAAIAQSGGHPSTSFAVPVYPAPDLVAAVPLALLPYKLAGIVFTLFGAAALGLGLWLLGVRDWRCYGAALLSWPVLHTLRLGQVNEFLILAAAIAWRWRPRALVTGAAVSAAVIAKLFLWPLGLFLLMTSRWRALATAAGLGIASLLLAWAIIAFAGLTTYPQMLSDLSSVEGTAGVSLVSLAAATGVGHSVGVAVSLLITLAMIAVAWTLLRFDGGERNAYGLLVIAGLTSSSLVWPHYMALLLVPIALLSPSFGPLWLVPLLGYLAPVELTNGDAWQIAVYLVMELVLVAALCRPFLVSWRRLVELDQPVKQRRGGELTGRLIHGLRSTSFRSYPAAQRPTEGP